MVDGWWRGVEHGYRFLRGGRYKRSRGEKTTRVRGRVIRRRSASTKCEPNEL
ncbi:hypothetical protein RSAG8_09137, partial [Rhizoctonia solani AG-8 WAC10335]